MLIKHKLISNVVIIIISMLIMLILLSFALSAFQKDIKIAETLGKIESSVLQLRRNEKDFLTRKDLKYQVKFDTRTAQLQSQITYLSEELSSIGLKLSEISRLKNIINQYHQHFTLLVKAQKIIGLNPKNGLYGQLRTAVHNVEALIGKQDYQLLSSMLQLRRNEKDFMLRLDEKYAKRFNNGFNKMNNKLNISTIDNANKIKKLLVFYQVEFNALVKQQKNIGLDHNKGLLGQMRKTIHQVDDILQDLQQKTKQEVFNYASFINNISYGLVFVVLIIALSTTWLVGKSILSSILSLRDAMSKVASTNDLTIQITTKGTDELADMAKTFNVMLTNFRNLIIEVNGSVSAVNEATGILSENIHTANHGVDAQMQETDMVATAVTEMVATVEEISNNTHEAASRAEITNINAEQGKIGVASTIQQIEILSQNLLESEQVVQALEKDSQTIGSVLDVIRGIAEQTNLLALNAAIEAARAGDQGRGFAVVADEVRTLASRTQDSTQEIETIINSLQDRTHSIVGLMANCRQQGDESAVKASSAGEILAEINNDVTTIMDMSAAIASAIKEQAMVAAEVNKRVVLIRDVAEQAGQSAVQNEHMSEELSQQAKMLHNEVSRFVV